MADLLVVDDDEDLGELVSEMLRTRGHVLRVAHNGNEGLKAIAERRPDLVMLDVEMPVLTGPETAYLLFLRDVGDDEIPIVLVSGIVDLPRVAAVVGTPYFLGKPYEVDALIQLIDRALVERIAPTRQGHP